MKGEPAPVLRGKRSSPSASRRETVPLVAAIDILKMSGKLSGMDTVTVRELQKNLKQALIRVQRGATLRVTRRRKVVAQIGPAQATAATKPWPDLGARAERVLGKKVLKSGAGDVILTGRGDW